MDVPDNRMDIQVIKLDSRPWAVGIVSDTKVEYETEIYTRRKLRGHDQTFEVFAPSGWTGDMLIRHLLHRASVR